MRGASRRDFAAVNPPRTARSPGPRRRRRLAARNSLSFERAELSRDGAGIRRILATSGESSSSRTDERRTASFEPRASAAMRPAVSSRGVTARAGRGTAGPSWSSGDARLPEGSSIPLCRRRTAPTARGSLRLPRCLRHRESVALPNSRRRAPRTSGGRRVGGRFHRPPRTVVVRKALRAARDTCGTRRVPRTVRTGGGAARERMTRELRSLEPRRRRHAAPRPFSSPGVGWLPGRNGPARPRLSGYCRPDRPCLFVGGGRSPAHVHRR